jgi:sec-independent protein translocase protein TatA
MSIPFASLFAILGLGPTEIIIILVLGVLLFGRKLPEVGKYLGKSIVEFKKGMKGLEDNVDSVGSPNMASTSAPVEPIRPPQKVTATAPKFEDAPNTGVTANPPQV